MLTFSLSWDTSVGIMLIESMCWAGQWAVQPSSKMAASIVSHALHYFCLLNVYVNI